MKKNLRPYRCFLLGLLATAAGLLPGGREARATPTQLAQQGRLWTIDNQPVDGEHSVVFALYDAAESGTTVWQEEQTVLFEHGYYFVLLGANTENPLADAVFDQEALFLGITLDGGDEFVPRHSVVSVPFARRAVQAGAVSGAGKTSDVGALNVNGVAVIDEDGQWVGPAISTMGKLSCLADGEVAAWDSATATWECRPPTALVSPDAHSSLSGLEADDHPHYLTTTRGDARYYTKTELTNGQLDGRYFTETELNAGQLNTLYFTEAELSGGQLDSRYFTETELSNGQLDSRYFTETELNAGQLNTLYFTETEFVTTSAGAADAGKPVVLDGTGKLSSTLLPSGSSPSSHSSLTDLSADDHTQYLNTTRGDARYYTETELTNGQLDSRYFTEGEFVATSAGAADAGKPVKLNGSGVLDNSLWPGGTAVVASYASTAAQSVTTTWAAINSAVDNIAISQPGQYVMRLMLGTQTSSKVNLGVRLRDKTAGVTRAKSQLGDTFSYAGNCMLIYQKSDSTAESLAIQWAASGNANTTAGATVDGETLNSISVHLTYSH